MAWFADFVQAIAAPLSIIGESAIDITPLGLAFSGPFALGAIGIAEQILTSDLHNKRIALYDDIKNSILDLNETTYENKNMLIGIQKMINENANDSKKMMNEIRETILKFEESMKKDIEGIKDFIIAKSFTDETVRKLRIVSSIMEILQESKTLDNLNTFKSEFDKNRPKKVLLDFAEGLEHQTSNPVASSMENNVLGSRDIFEKYSKLFATMVANVHLIEAYHYGVVDDPKDDYKTHMREISRYTNKATKLYHKHVTNYKLKEELYWPDAVEKVMNADMDKYKHHLSDGLDVIKMADNLKTQIDGIRTTDVFSIYVFECRDSPFLFMFCEPKPLMRFGNSTHGYLFKSDIEQMKRFMVTRSVNAANVVILRSTKFKTIPKETLSNVRASFQAYLYPIKQLKGEARLTAIHSGNDSFLAIMDNYFKPNLNLINGFSSFLMNNTPEVRFTNNGSAIITNDEQKGFFGYYGLNWL